MAPIRFPSTGYAAAEPVPVHPDDEALALLRGARRVLVVGHVHPDCDAAGAVTALGQALRQDGRTVTMAIEGGLPPELRFLPGAEDVRDRAEATGGLDLVVFVDSSDVDVIGASGRALLSRSIPTLVIDHHETNTRYGDCHVVVPEAVSTTEILYHLFRRLDWGITPAMATCLMTGIVTDTLFFRVGPVAPSTFALVGALMDRGADLQAIRRRTLGRPVEIDRLRLLGTALSRARLEHGVAWTVVSAEDFHAAGVPAAAPVRCVDRLLNTESCVIAAEFTGLDTGQVKVSLRSLDGYDVGRIAADLGGGGHVKAGGCTLEGLSLEEAVARVLPLLRAEAESRKV